METMKPRFFCSCGKQFSSGKAMGGHKKVHSSQKLRIRDDDDDGGPGKKNNLNGAAAAAVIGVPPKKRKVIMEDEDEKNSEAAEERYFCSICGVHFRSHRSLGAHNGHHTKAAKKMVPSKVDGSSSSSSDDDRKDEDYDVNEEEEEEEEEVESETDEKREEYKCPYNCDRVFLSGKALGGHKRHCRSRAAAGVAGDSADHGREAAADEDRNGGGGGENSNRLGFDLNEIPDSDNEYNGAE